MDKAEHEAFLAARPTHHLLATIGDKWTALVLSELRAALPSASQKS
ncbi:hypothetical protein [Allokutzneria oryzae]|uniref:Transcriptional regulator n=1 Tax=Allokutzneria oryzae TaxID=1378989 RepID=A0ABV5ZSX3_9PSEU